MTVSSDWRVCTGSAAGADALAVEVGSPASLANDTGAASATRATPAINRRRNDASGHSRRVQNRK